MANTPIAGIPAGRIEKLDRSKTESITTEQRLKAIFEIWWFLAHEREAPTILLIRNHIVDKLGILLADQFIIHAVHLSDNHVFTGGKVCRL